MSGKFPLRSKKIQIREKPVTIRELTQAERVQFIKGASEDKFRAPALLIAFCCVEPTFTEAELADESAEVVELLASEIMKLSGIDVGEKAAGETDAKKV